MMDLLKVTRGLAYVNHGQWLADCPTCGSPIRVDPLKPDQAICGACHPQLFATKQVEVPVTVEDLKIEPTATRSFRSIPDGEVRRKAYDVAEKHKIVFPENWQEIIDTLRSRRTQYMNWLPGETVDVLIAENIEHGVMEV
jgi:hypothetical protein